MSVPATAPSTLPKTAGSRWFPGWLVRIPVALCLIGIVYLRMREASLDNALINIFTLMLGFIAATTLLGWFCFRSSYSRRTRYGVLGGVVGLIVMASVLLRVEDVDGNMIPRFGWRLNPKTDSRLGRVETPPAAPVVQPVIESAPDPISESAAGDFPQFLGPNRTNHLTVPGFATDWQAAPPKQLWRQPIGAGWSAFAVVGTRAVTMEQRGEEEWVTCYDVSSGRSLWGHAITARHETTLGGIGPRSTPTIHEGRVFALGATGVLRCLDLVSGQLNWQLDLLERYGVSQEVELANIAWGRSNSPLAIDDLVVVPAGGKQGATKSLLALKQATGEVAWEGGFQQVSYVSPIEATLCGVRQIVTVNESSFGGHNPQTGTELWLNPWPGNSNADATASQPHVLPGDRVLLSKGYGEGAAVWQITLADGKWDVSLVWQNRSVLKTKFTNVTIIGENAYGLSDGILECVDLATGKSRWKKGRYSHGQVLGVNNLLLVQAEKGSVALVAANPEKYEELAIFPALSSKTWANPTLVGNRLLVRNSDEAACYELR